MYDSQSAERLQQIDMLKLEQGAFEQRIRQLTSERDNLLELNRILEADRKTLINDLTAMQQVSRQSYADLQREYIELEKKYHDIKVRQDACTFCSAEGSPNAAA